MGRRERTAIMLAALQAADLAYTSLSADYGDEHLDHLGVPRGLRRVLPGVKAAAVVALLFTTRRPVGRSVVGGALVGYYSAAVAFHRASGDPISKAAPAAALGVMAATLV